MIKKGLKIILLGPQACGKGTQGKLLSDLFNIIKISTGEMFRKEISEQTKLGKEIENLISSGILISNDITFRLLKKRLENIDCRNGFILDGYPRSIEQVRFLENITNIDLAIEINIPNNEAQRRIENRRVCGKCGKSYDLILFPPKKKDICDKCGGVVVKRSDDYPEAIKKRLSIYREEVRPIIKFYKKKNILIEVSGVNKVENIFDEIKKKIIKKMGGEII